MIMDLAPFKLDIDELLDEFTEGNLTTLTDFKRLWAARKFSYIYEARPTTNSAFFMQSLFSYCISNIVSQAPLARRLGGLYCLYCLHQTQPYKPSFKIYLSLDELRRLRKLVIDAKENGIKVVIALVKRMLVMNMFLFGSVDIAGGSVTQRVEEITKLQNKHIQIAYYCLTLRLRTFCIWTSVQKWSLKYSKKCQKNMKMQSNWLSKRLVRRLRFRT
ncbi:uncharacterized protein LOC120260539 isoform X2 [Dioscorea cayenensis subsp. rotundata]|uniref:Uncharacterized protein LOC120260539 isoform X2 n=1 Tax=Dioscorea cayennensis subsp. rotundata TaxID=55577 RepID=A0AB40BA58_DIOCR|nr:uncharacterized protein LOC120260539 isoform X2 [Dioscorea cayenensis subsp. rotundata]